MLQGKLLSHAVASRSNQFGKTGHAILHTFSRSRTDLQHHCIAVIQKQRYISAWNATIWTWGGYSAVLSAVAF